MHPLLQYLNPQLDEMIRLLGDMVNVESPSTDKPAVDRFADYMKQLFGDIGVEAEILHQQQYGNNVRLHWGTGDKQILVLCHMDTVWDVGEVARRPFRVENGRAYGPGAYDMKGGIVALYYAIKTMRQLGIKPKSRITMIFNSDEEIGSWGSRSAIEEEARRSAYAIVLEPGVAPDGRMKTARKGTADFEVTVRGRASHAGSAPEKGISAILEMSHQVIKLMGLTNFATGTTVNVGVISGGTRPNVIAAEAVGKVDVRVATMAEAERVLAEITGIKPVLQGTEVRVTGGMDRPPFERTPAVVECFHMTRALAAEIGFELNEGSTGGVSDGNLTAALGTPTLDGLGMVGNGSHSVDEYVELKHLPERAALLIRLFETL